MSVPRLALRRTQFLRGSDHTVSALARSTSPSPYAARKKVVSSQYTAVVRHRQIRRSRTELMA